MSSSVAVRLRPIKRAVAAVCNRLFPALWLKSRIWRRDRNFEPEYFFLGGLCDPRRVSIDVGGNAGEYAYWLSLHSRLVYVYEPNPICLALINRLRRSNMMLRPVALSDRQGVSTLVFQCGNTGIGSIAAGNPVTRRGGESGFATVEVRTARLDDDFDEQAGLIKIDVEGHEAAVLAGAERLLARDRPRLMIEVEARHTPDAHRRVQDQLQPLGYRRFYLADGRLVGLPWDADAARLQTAAPGAPGYVYNFFFIHCDDPAAAAAVAPDR